MVVAEPKADVPGITRPMTYEEYMAGPEEMARYDILDGWKVYRLYGKKQLANLTRQHQHIQGNLYLSMRDYERTNRGGEAIISPCDVSITVYPLHTRQPDVLFISSKRLAQNPPADDPTPLSPAPELVVEIVSPSDRPTVLAAKTDDYRAVDVQEMWIVRSEERTIEVLTLADGTSRVYEPGETATSAIFDGLAVSVDAMFEE